MENSSYSVKPELYSDKLEKLEIQFIEEIYEIKKLTSGVHMVTNLGELYLLLYINDIIRIVTSIEPVSLDQSFSLEDIDLRTAFDLKTENNITILSYDDLSIHINHHPFVMTFYKGKELKFVQKAIGFHDSKSYLVFNRDRDGFIYGLGEKTGYLNKNNEKTVNFNKDVYEPHTRTNKELYQSINMFTYLSKDATYGLFVDNPSRLTFDFASKPNESIITTEVGQLDYYIYVKDNLKDIVRAHALLTGTTYLPPIWALGYHQSRHSYESVEKLLDIYQNFKDRFIPVDAIYLDILYMDKYKVFTFNPKTYGNIKDAIVTLKEDGVKVVPIVDPGIKVEEGYSVYDEGVKEDLFCKYKDGSLYIGEVWPGDSAFYDFTNTKIRSSWGMKHKYYTDLGIEGIWNDMNEPAVFRSHLNTMDLDVLHNVDGKIKTHREMHNLYGLGMSMATFEGLEKLLNKRPFVLTRAGYAGIQKYATVWTGDNRSSWEHLEMTIPMCLNLNMSGVSLCGPDIGGFSDDCTEELLIRWTQMGTFLPFFRNHSSINIVRQEPWAFGKRCEDITRKFIQLRYELIRYIYSEVYKSHLTGVPVMRPLVLEYEDDPLTYSIHDQFLLGEHLMIAPIIRPGETYRKVYLPKGIWYDFFSHQKYYGGQMIIVKAALDEIPVFVKAGSVIPISEVAFNTSKLSKNVTLNVYLDEHPFTSSFFVDDYHSLRYKNKEYKEIRVSYDKEVHMETTGNYKNDEIYQIKIIK